ncbi:hypothetical protein B0H12DRAFT_1234111 [Mycena haematopus]|nr:hypothetical protein B0H12DRAFT_1234111 [Mycena haematopus]
MVHTTRSGSQQSPWELDLLDDASLPNVDFFRSRVSLEPHLRAAMAAADLHAAAADAREEEAVAEAKWQDDDEDEEPVVSRSPTPLSWPPSPLTLLSSRSPSPLSDLRPSPNPTRSADPPTIPRYKLRQRDAKRRRLSRKPIAAAQVDPFGPLPKARHSQKYREQSPHQTDFHAREIHSTSGGNWTGPRPSKKARPWQYSHPEE